MFNTKSNSKRFSSTTISNANKRANSFITSEGKMMTKISTVKAEIEKSDGKSFEFAKNRMLKNKLSILEGKLSRLSSNRQKVELRLKTYISNNKALDK